MTWYRQCNCPTTRAKLILKEGENFDTPACLNCDTKFSKVCNDAKANAFNNTSAAEKFETLSRHDSDEENEVEEED